MFVSLVVFSHSRDGQQPVIRVESPLVLVDVITQDTKTALPVSGLKKEDFRVFDNGLEMPIQSFDLGARYGVRPITLWFAVICNEVDWDENGSGFIRGKSKLLRSSLDHLDQNDTVGVAHWCDDKTCSIDYAIPGFGRCPREAGVHPHSTSEEPEHSTG